MPSVFLLVLLTLLAAVPTSAAVHTDYALTPRDTVGWWVRDVRVPDAYVGSALKGSANFGVLHAVHLPIGPDRFDPVPRDTTTQHVGSAGYDLEERSFSVLFVPIDTCGMRVSAADVYELESRSGAALDLRVALTLHPTLQQRPLPNRLAASARLIAWRESSPKRTTVRDWRSSADAPAMDDTLVIPWRAKSKDRLCVRVVLEASARARFAGYSMMGIEAALRFEGLPEGVTVRSTRMPPPPPPRVHPGIKSLYR